MKMEIFGQGIKNHRGVGAECTFQETVGESLGHRRPHHGAFHPTKCEFLTGTQLESIMVVTEKNIVR